MELCLDNFRGFSAGRCVPFQAGEWTMSIGMST
jgi:hypothetical protein